MHACLFDTCSVLHYYDLGSFRREALSQWKQKFGCNATYNKLSGVFERAGYQQYADTVRKLVQPQYSDEDDSSCDEDPFPLPQPLSYPNLKSPSPVQLPLPFQSYQFVDPPEGKN